MNKVAAISDTHMNHDQVYIPDNIDILIHCGDMTNNGTLEELGKFSSWLHCVEARRKIVIAGNHDHCFENNPEKCRAAIEAYDNRTHYLFDESIELFGNKIYGTPWQPEFSDMAFNLERGEALKEKYKNIPDDTDILVTHSPPYQVLDFAENAKAAQGSKALKEKVVEVQPDFHLFGHIHESYGTKSDYSRDIQYINCSTNDLLLRPVNNPFVFEI